MFLVIFWCIMNEVEKEKCMFLLLFFVFDVFLGVFRGIRGIHVKSV